MSPPGASVALELDVQGTFCPRPVIETARAIKEVALGEILQVVGTDRGMHTDFPAWCKATGHELVDMQEEGNRIIVSIRRVR